MRTGHKKPWTAAKTPWRAVKQPRTAAEQPWTAVKQPWTAAKQLAGRQLNNLLGLIFGEVTLTKKQFFYNNKTFLQKRHSIIFVKTFFTQILLFNQ